MATWEPAASDEPDPAPRRSEPLPVWLVLLLALALITVIELAGFWLLAGG